MAWHTPLGYTEYQLETKLILISRIRVFSPAWVLCGRLMVNSRWQNIGKGYVSLP